MDRRRAFSRMCISSPSSVVSELKPLSGRLTTSVQHDCRAVILMSKRFWVNSLWLSAQLSLKLWWTNSILLDPAPSLRNWMLDVLTNRPQTVRIHNISSSLVIPKGLLSYCSSLTALPMPEMSFSGSVDDTVDVGRIPGSSSHRRWWRRSSVPILL